MSKPNILVIFSDDVGPQNLSCFSHGLLGYKTPNLDRIAKEGGMFTDYYAENSCTAGRAAFITGQAPVRTGLSKVGLPGSKLGLSDKDATLAELLKPHGYKCGQFGKNHLGDRNEFLPTAHGFDEFYGNLYHLNAHVEPYNEDYPKDPAFKERYAPRDVVHSWATAEEQEGEDPRFGKAGKQKIEEIGPLDLDRIPIIDEEYLEQSLRFIRAQHEAGTPFFCWHNASRMHFPTMLKEESRGVTGQGIFADGMVEHDGHVGQLLDLLDELGIAEDTIVVYASDNGPMFLNWPDGGTTAFRSEKNTNWEGAWRVPALVRWTGTIPAGSVFNDLVSHTDWVPTLYAAVTGDTDLQAKLRDGMEVGEKSFKIHLDGVNILPYLKGESEASGRKSFFYFGDSGELLNVRYGDWKCVFAEQRGKQWMIWREPFTPMRAPKLYNLRRDPFERGFEESVVYETWFQERQFILVPISEFVVKMLATFEEFPPRFKAPSYSLSNALEMIETAQG
ncbi:arylsulfatase [Sphingomonas sp. OV641]|uniref:arylsulfatase n=1 Tax=Sphingomonas sp. OV641 TaxID=1881068 RepID=UPI0008BB8701|nr:arylsulfatase [Sphingomonas sp. OV641]SEI76539.1 arylsulfatase [Sphingomonas sp. OV641]